MIEHLPFLLGKLLFGGFFVFFGLQHFLKLQAMSSYAKSKGIPQPKTSTILSGLLIIAGGLGVMFEYHMSVSLIFIVLFLIPTSILMHNFWTCTTPEDRQTEFTQFMKNIALAGGALMLYSLI
ncbi:MAG: DoxX family protein [Candidatus Paceibacterota bacterium]